MNENKMITMLLNHEDRLEYIQAHMVTKTILQEMSENIDAILKIVLKNSDELAAVVHALGRHEKTIESIKQSVQNNDKSIENLAKDVRGIKVILQMS